MRSISAVDSFATSSGMDESAKGPRAWNKVLFYLGFNSKYLRLERDDEFDKGDMDAKFRNSDDQIVKVFNPSALKFPCHPE